MPVWHRETAEWRASGELAVVGITQEQHPDRCRLFAQWHGIEWPILWDPFNVTGSEAVPFACAVDEHGVVRETVRDTAALEPFLAAEHAPPAGAERATLFRLDAPGPFAPAHHAALRDLLTRAPGERAPLDVAIATLERLVAEHPADGALRFHAGVARRMRVDSPHAEPGDFQAALDHWAGALERNPNQYVRRRRIQQYGPRLDKPYPFYGWVEEARAAIRARGDEPVALAATLTGAEFAERAAFAAAADETQCPDPDGEIARDEDGLVRVDAAVAWDASRDTPTATVHLALTPDPERDVHWTNDAGPLVVWIGDPDLPDGWEASRRRLTDAGPPRETSAETRRLDVELRLPEDAGGGELAGFALYYVCEGADGVCVYRRRDFDVALTPPR